MLLSKKKPRMKTKLPNFENWKHHNLAKFSRAAYFKILELEAEIRGLQEKLEKVNEVDMKKGKTAKKGFLMSDGENDGKTI